MMHFFDYNPTVPLDAQIVEQSVMLGHAREKIAFTSCTGERIAGWFALPDVAGAPPPCVLIVHGADSDKDTWWRADNPTGPLVPRLLEAGYAVFMLDAASFGERRLPRGSTDSANSAVKSAGRDRFRDLISRTIGDYRRALDYLETRAEVSPSCRGVFGYSMGGIAAAKLVAVESRLQAGVICVAPPMINTGVLRLRHARLAAIAPDIAPRALAEKPLLFLMARRDIYYSVDEAEVLIGLVPGSAKQLKFFDSGHILPPAYIDDTVNWFAQHLNP